MQEQRLGQHGAVRRGAGYDMSDPFMVATSEMDFTGGGKRRWSLNNFTGGVVVRKFAFCFSTGRAKLLPKISKTCPDTGIKVYQVQANSEAPQVCVRLQALCNASWV